MGQDTYIDFGVAVCLDLCFNDIKMVQTLLHNMATHYNEFGIRCYIVTDYDEIISFDDSSFTLEQIDALAASVDKNAFNEIMVSNKLTEVEFKFLIPCSKAYARNISRRDNPFIFGNDDCEDVEDVCTKFMQAKAKFMELGVSKDLIWTGYTVKDSY
jgi:hypothetical protein